ncbi:MAG: DMT family transporter [Scytonematopsis contorta HA4267-MV1]|jgi:drug/metabolite transporter (DMT)-like permease|nr:DMT family transporter [Scytonematopsis contorta HA4267-MV1]
MNRLHQVSRKIPGQVYLWLAILIFGASNSVTRKLTEIGANNFVAGRNPVSLCNVLFVGNICALLVLIIVYREQCKISRLRQLSRNRWFYMTIAAILAGGIAPAFVFQALDLTMVNNVVLVGRLEPPLFLALCVWLLGEQVNFWEVLGAFVSFIGVILTIFLQPSLQEMMVMGFMVGKGEILTAVAAVASAISAIIVKAKLSQIPLGLYSIFRTSIGTVIFFVLAIVLYGSHHFMDAFSPFLWKWMLIYGPVIVVVGQSFWLTGLRASTVSQASLVGSFTPIAGIVTAYLILGEAPTLAQYIGGSMILIGVFISQVGIWRKQSRQDKNSQVNSTGEIQEVENKIGFKGM